MDAPVKVRQQFPRVVRFNPREIREAVREVEGAPSPYRSVSSSEASPESRPAD